MLFLNKNHSLNQSKTLWWMVTPSTYGSGRMIDLMGNYNGTLLYNSGGSTASMQFKGPTMSGQYGRITSTDGKGYVQSGVIGGAKTKFTISLWFNVTVNTQFQGLFSWGASSTDVSANILFQARSTTTLGWILYNSGLTAYSGLGGSWHHTAVTFDNTLTNNCSQYLDGVLKQTTAVNSQYSESGGNYIYLNEGYDAPLVGSYDNLQIWNRCLTAQEIYQDYSLYKLGYPGVLTQKKYRGIPNTTIAISGNKNQMLIGVPY